MFSELFELQCVVVLECPSIKYTSGYIGDWLIGWWIGNLLETYEVVPYFADASDASVIWYILWLISIYSWLYLVIISLDYELKCIYNTVLKTVSTHYLYHSGLCDLLVWYNRDYTCSLGYSCLIMNLRETHWVIKSIHMSS